MLHRLRLLCILCRVLLLWMSRKELLAHELLLALARSWTSKLLLGIGQDMRIALVGLVDIWVVLILRTVLGRLPMSLTCKLRGLLKLVH